MHLKSYIHENFVKAKLIYKHPFLHWYLVLQNPSTPRFSSRKNHPQEHARTGFCIHYTAIINTRSRQYIQLLQNALSCLQTAYSNPTLPLTPLAPPHRIVTDHIASTGGRWQDRHGNLLYPAIWSPTGWRMGFPNAKMFKVFFSEGQVCFNSRWLKIYGTSKIPRNILGTLTFHHPFGRLPRACHWWPFSHALRQAL